MLELEAFPFGGDEVALARTLDDPTFRYQPNVICSACRELLTLGLELHKKLGRVMHEGVKVKYNFGDLSESADLGCHMCALIKTSALGIRQDPPKPMVSSEVKFSLSPAFEDTHFQISYRFTWKQEDGVIRSTKTERIYISPIVGNDNSTDSLTKLNLPMPSLGRDTGDEETFALAKAWLTKCLKEHVLCGENDDKARRERPARLLVLDDKIKLVNSGDSQARDQPYISLSHCWGDPSRVPQLNARTEPELRSGFDFNYLPKTFQDAVIITRKLGYRLLWIDSLCIMQDSPADWEDQAKIMALVYVNSVFTIAALKSPGSYDGCFTSERNPLGLATLDLQDLGITVRQKPPDLFWETEVNTSGYGASPLHTRAWVVQERLSSPRTLLYGSRGIYWECRCAQASELHYNEVAKYDSKNKKTWLEKLEASAADMSTGAKMYNSNWMSVWRDLLKTYSGCSLTHGTDRLIAVTGLISEVERRTKLKCVIGLWENDLASMALWYRIRNDPIFAEDELGTVENDMPSWSWASVKGRCSYHISGGLVEWEVKASIQELKTDKAQSSWTMRFDSRSRKVLLNANEEDNYDLLLLDPDEFGPERSTWEGVEGTVLILDPYDRSMARERWGGDMEERYTWFPDSELSDEKQEMFVVLIQRILLPGTWSARCLVVTPSVNQREEKTFTRCGICTIRYSDSNHDPFYSKDGEAAEVIVLE